MFQGCINMVPLLYQQVQGERRQPADCYLNLQLKLIHNFYISWSKHSSKKQVAFTHQIKYAGIDPMSILIWRPYLHGYQQIQPLHPSFNMTGLQVKQVQLLHYRKTVQYHLNTSPKYPRVTSSSRLWHY